MVLVFFMWSSFIMSCLMEVVAVVVSASVKDNGKIDCSV